MSCVLYLVYSILLHSTLYVLMFVDFCLWICRTPTLPLFTRTFALSLYHTFIFHMTTSLDPLPPISFSLAAVSRSFISVLLSSHCSLTSVKCLILRFSLTKQKDSLSRSKDLVSFYPLHAKAYHTLRPATDL